MMIIFLSPKLNLVVSLDEALPPSVLILISLLMVISFALALSCVVSEIELNQQYLHFV